MTSLILQIAVLATQKQVFLTLLRVYGSFRWRRSFVRITAYVTHCVAHERGLFVRTYIVPAMVRSFRPLQAQTLLCLALLARCTCWSSPARGPWRASTGRRTLCRTSTATSSRLKGAKSRAGSSGARKEDALPVVLYGLPRDLGATTQSAELQLCSDGVRNVEASMWRKDGIARRVCGAGFGQPRANNSRLPGLRSMTNTVIFFVLAVTAARRNECILLAKPCAGPDEILHSELRVRGRAFRFLHGQLRRRAIYGRPSLAGAGSPRDVGFAKAPGSSISHCVFGILFQGSSFVTL